MNRYKKYSCKEFLDELLRNFKDELDKYDKTKKDMSKISGIKNIISSGYVFALIADAIKNYPSLLATYKGLFSKYLDASAALYVLLKTYE